MLKIILLRVSNSDQGTFGYWIHPETTLCTGELPWRNNHTNISCIPVGTYHVIPYTSHKFGKVWHILNVPNRSYILCHSGNVCGNTEEGYHTHSEGCILLGKYIGRLNYKGVKQKAVLSSKSAIRKLHRLNVKKFELEVRNYGS